MSTPPAWLEPALALFREACELPVDQRDAFLDGRCGADVELRAHVAAMLARDTADLAGEEAPNGVRAALSDIARGAEFESIPQAIGGYRIVRLIAHGGMGVVYEAEQENPRRRVALKVARVGGTTGERARRFELEAQLLARLDHPRIARIIETGTTGPEAGDQPFFVMEFVEGRPLTDYAEAHLRTARDKLEQMVAVCEAVGFAHRQGVIHRDLKPDNVFVDARGQPKVLDFGVAKVEAAGGFGAATLRTEAGRVLGTLGYMAPEQLGGQTEGLGPQADVYSLGVMIYELLTGRLPHDLTAATPTRALAIVTSTDAPLLGVVRPEYRGDIEALVAKALEKDPRHRYADAVALQRDLERFLRGEPTLARPAGPFLKLAKWTRRKPAQATAVFGLFLALAAVAGVLLVKNREVQTALDEFELLADSKRLERAAIEADDVLGEGLDELGNPRALRTLPARSDKKKVIGDWLTDHLELADPDRLALYRSTLAGIRQLADDPEATWTFGDPVLQLKHDVLAKMVADLEEFRREETGLYARMEARLKMANTIEERTVDEFQEAWDAVNERIRANEKYRGSFGDDARPLDPQVGLIPLGMDPDSRLEEFLHFETHAGAIPVRHPKSGRLPRVTDDTGIVFVLIPAVPGEKVWMGAQSEHWDKPYHDAYAIPFERRREEELDGPFFLSKYEMTQGQWLRTTGDNPSPGPQSLAQPVNMVSWEECVEAMSRLGLRLPSEWEWEYAARAGSTDAWWAGPDEVSLAGKENVFDRTAAWKHPGWSARWKVTTAPWWDAVRLLRLALAGPRGGGPALVGSHAHGANGFGLFDVAGNVAEWSSSLPFDRTPVVGHQGRLMRSRIIRGGSFKAGIDEGRSAARRDYLPIFWSDQLGLRPAMSIQH